MAEDKSDIDVDEDFETEGEAPDTVEPIVSKTNLTKRRLIDNMLEERRLKKQISEYDFDL
ncbi:PA3496 family putative envelope integrity protein [Pseudomonas oryzihabitans]|uniref:Leucyl-tRNA synthetase n=1 Tax=Pseudomonas oryzihabitans TaxID=47885 RepID=A0AAJ2EUG6_9PSED|nr:hypothetical protein [Pseudomonas psychrotolerans]MDR6232587.1 hypothetical protein [Pseudomonas psychrotolerans]MDR6358482.1 hypothetical protein [Pseudomonas psychrotolerans]MDR6679991.1 hypothetical protein [Pseudomonas psychrotolerans]QDD87765.1 hypothetical protein CCZ28_01565 [Pseudomonas psychrotolerans]